MTTLPRRPARLVLHALAVLLTACSGDSGSTTGPPAAREPVEVAGRPQRGPADAWVTLVEFSDFECPFCANVEPTLVALSAEYASDLRLVYRHFPLSSSLHPRARPAAVASECAFTQSADGFWAYHDLLFATGALDDADLAAHAAAAGLDVPAWEACIAGAAAAAAVDADRSAGLAAGVRGTPTFFVNGRALEGAQPIREFRDAIDRARSEAQASGIARAEYYDRAVLGR